MNVTFSSIELNYKRLIPIASLLIILWFIPWTPLLNLGILFYFPYKPDGKSRYLRVTGPIVRYLGGDWVPASEIPSYCSKGIVGAEDGSFYEHHGVDWVSLKDSFKTNIKYKKRLAGGSTITMQLVKNGFLHRRKTIIRKVREIIGALLLDLTVGKDRQIVWYLNVVEYGPEIYGIKQASRFYFKKDPKGLTKDQCVSLLALLPSPVKRGIKFQKGIKDAKFTKRYHSISYYLNAKK